MGFVLQQLKRLLLSASAVLWLAATGLAAGNALNLTAEEKAWLSQHPVIRIGVMNDWPPLNFTDSNGKPQGIGAAYVDVINKRLNGAIVLYPDAFEDSYDKVQRGQLDALMDISSRPERENLFHFTRPYISIPHVIVGRKDGPYFKSEQNLSGKSVALERGFYNVTHFKKSYPEVLIREYGTTAEALDAVSRGEADAYAGNRAVAIYLIEKEVFNNLQLMGKLQEPRSVLKIGVNKDKPLLAAILDKALNSISEKEQSTILARWTSVRYEQGINYPLIIKVVSVSLLLLSLFAWWILRLAKEIRIRKRAEGELSRYREHLETMVQERSKALAESEAFLSSIIENIPNMIFVKGASDLKFIKFNRAGEQLLGIPRAELIGKNDYDFFPKEEADYFTARDQDVLTTGRGLDIPEEPIQTKTGLKKLHTRKFPILDQDGTPRYLVGISEDVTARKQTEELLRKSEERYRLLVEQSSAWIWKTDTALRHTFSNDNVEKILGYSAAELCAMDALTIVHPDDHDALRKAAEDAFSARHGWSGLVLRWQTREGVWRSIESSGMPIFDENGECTGLQGVDTDITEKIQLEAEREKGQRLESLGVLAGGIAHDFNNILTGIVGNLSLARMMIDAQHRAAGRLAECEKAAKRASELTQQLLTFARGGEPVKKSVDVSRLIAEAVSFGLRGSNVKAVLELDAELWPVDADEGQLNQSLNNLLINAVQAMPNGGMVTVSGNNVIVDDANGTPQRFVRLIIRDTGGGIPADVLPKVFDPYFTTKAHGSGLGLASVHSIVTRHGGTVQVSSETGKGTEFAICLPAAEKPAVKGQDNVSTRLAGGAAAHVLVMDDEQMIVEVLAIMLDELGCTVDTCSDGAEAVTLYQTAMNRGKRYDVVILDLTVPGGMGGLETARRIKNLDPEATLIVSSGYSNDDVMADYPGHGFSGQIIKPYSMETLSAELGKVL